MIVSETHSSQICSEKHIITTCFLLLICTHLHMDWLGFPEEPLESMYIYIYRIPIYQLAVRMV